ncbi:snare-like protein [Atractiella rhizophila]|nr:snare-like protein [Atractiella rhizophila]
MTQNLSLYSTTAVLILDNEGQRLLAKYYTHPTVESSAAPSAGGVAGAGASSSANGAGKGGPFATVKEQRAFETSIWEKTKKVPNGEILLHASHLILYKPSVDLTLYIVGPESENELMLSSLLNSLYESLSTVLRHQFEKRSVLENLDLVVLTVDETVDDGIILELDSPAILSRVSRPRTDAGVQIADITINEETLRQAFGTIRDRVRRLADS